MFSKENLAKIFSKEDLAKIFASIARAEGVSNLNNSGLEKGSLVEICFDGLSSLWHPAVFVFYTTTGGVYEMNNGDKVHVSRFSPASVRLPQQKPFDKLENGVVDVVFRILNETQNGPINKKTQESCLSQLKSIFDAARKEKEAA